MPRLFRWSENTKDHEDNTYTMVRKELDALWQARDNVVSKTQQIVQQSYGSVSTTSTTNTYNIHINTIVELSNATNYFKIAQNYQAATEPYRTLIRFSSLNSVHVNVTAIDINGTATTQRFNESLTGTGFSPTLNNVLEYGVRFTGYKLDLKIEERTASALVTSSYWTGTTTLTAGAMQSAYSAGTVTLMLEVVLNVTL